MIDPPPVPAGKWADLRTRLLSAIAMVVVGALEVWLGGTAFAALVIVLTAVMIWELAAMTALARRTTRSAKAVASAAGAALLLSLALRSDIASLFLMVPTLILILTPRRDRRLAGAYALAIMLSGYGLVELRQETGTSAILWLILVVVASDVLGYFVGRTVGGPKFWERISPKKTWSGTVAGWAGAAMVGFGFVVFGSASWLLVPLSALLAFAGQLGDIAESWIKRRAGVKDASSLIPGHGGVLDRFDALIGAIVAVTLLGLFLPVASLLGN